MPLPGDWRLSFGPLRHASSLPMRLFSRSAQALAKQAWRPAAIQFIKALRADPNVEIVATDPVLWQEAFDLFGARTDKEWSLTDCLSFVLMSRRDITNALAADEHFRQAGFVPLLLAE